jgi:hypothetical protein
MRMRIRIKAPKPFKKSQDDSSPQPQGNPQHNILSPKAIQK